MPTWQASCILQTSAQWREVRENQLDSQTWQQYKTQLSECIQPAQKTKKVLLGLNILTHT